MTDIELPGLVDRWRKDSGETFGEPRWAWEMAIRKCAAELEAALSAIAARQEEPLNADMAKALPGGVIDDTTFDQIEHALDRAGALACSADGKWLTLLQRIESLAARQEGSVMVPREMTPEMVSAFFESAHPRDCWEAILDAAPKIGEAK